LSITLAPRLIDISIGTELQGRDCEKRAMPYECTSKLGIMGGLIIRKARHLHTTLRKRSGPLLSNSHPGFVALPSVIMVSLLNIRSAWDGPLEEPPIPLTQMYDQLYVPHFLRLGGIYTLTDRRVSSLQSVQLLRISSFIQYASTIAALDLSLNSQCSNIVLRLPAHTPARV
jgi:hypothetical protein